MGPKKQKGKMPVDGVDTTAMSREQLEAFCIRLREELDREREERNFFQLERDKLRTFWEITRQQLEESRSQLRNQDRAIDELEEKHQAEIKVYKQKVKHLLYEHQSNLSELKVESMVSLKQAQDDYTTMELQLLKDKKELKEQIHATELAHLEEIKQLKIDHSCEVSKVREQLESDAAELERKYEARLQSQADEQAVREQMEQAELETRKNQHIVDLTKQHETAFQEMKNYYNDITLNNLALISSLKEQMEELKSSHDRMENQLGGVQAENKKLAEPLKLAQTELGVLRRQLATFEQDKVTLSNTKQRLSLVTKELEDLRWENDVLELRFEKVEKERDRLHAEFVGAVLDVQQKTGLKGALLEKRMTSMRSGVSQRSKSADSLTEGGRRNAVRVFNVLGFDGQRTRCASHVRGGEQPARSVLVDAENRLHTKAAPPSRPATTPRHGSFTKENQSNRLRCARRLVFRPNIIHRPIRHRLRYRAGNPKDDVGTSRNNSRHKLHRLPSTTEQVSRSRWMKVLKFAYPGVSTPLCRKPASSAANSRGVSDGFDTSEKWTILVRQLSSMRRPLRGSSDDRPAMSLADNTALSSLANCLCPLRGCSECGVSETATDQWAFRSYDADHNIGVISELTSCRTSNEASLHEHQEEASDGHSIEKYCVCGQHLHGHMPDHSSLDKSRLPDAAPITLNFNFLSTNCMRRRFYPQILDYVRTSLSPIHSQERPSDPSIHEHSETNSGCPAEDKEPSSNSVMADRGSSVNESKMEHICRDTQRGVGHAQASCKLPFSSEPTPAAKSKKRTPSRPFSATRSDGRDSIFSQQKMRKTMGWQSPHPACSNGSASSIAPTPASTPTSQVYRQFIRLPPCPKLPWHHGVKSRYMQHTAPADGEPMCSSCRKRAWSPRVTRTMKTDLQVQTSMTEIRRSQANVLHENKSKNSKVAAGTGGIGSVNLFGQWRLASAEAESEAFYSQIVNNPFQLSYASSQVDRNCASIITTPKLNDLPKSLKVPVPLVEKIIFRQASARTPSLDTSTFVSSQSSSDLTRCSTIKFDTEVSKKSVVTASKSEDTRNISKEHETHTLNQPSLHQVYRCQVPKARRHSASTKGEESLANKDKAELSSRLGDNTLTRSLSPSLVYVWNIEPNDRDTNICESAGHHEGRKLYVSGEILENISMTVGERKEGEPQGTGNQQAPFVQRMELGTAQMVGITEEPGRAAGYETRNSVHASDAVRLMPSDYSIRSSLGTQSSNDLSFSEARAVLGSSPRTSIGEGGITGLTHRMKPMASKRLRSKLMMICSHFLHRETDEEQSIQGLPAVEAVSRDSLVPEKRVFDASTAGSSEEKCHISTTGAVRNEESEKNVRAEKTEGSRPERARSVVSQISMQSRDFTAAARTVPLATDEKLRVGEVTNFDQNDSSVINESSSLSVQQAWAQPTSSLLRSRDFDMSPCCQCYAKIAVAVDSENRLYCKDCAENFSAVSQDSKSTSIGATSTVVPVLQSAQKTIRLSMKTARTFQSGTNPYQPQREAHTPDSIRSKHASPQLFQHELAEEDGARSYVLPSTIADYEKDDSGRAAPAELPQQHLETEVIDANVCAPESASRQNEARTLRWKQISKQLRTCNNDPFLQQSAPRLSRLSLGSEKLSTTSPQLLQHELAKEDSAHSIAEHEKELVDHRKRASLVEQPQQELELEVSSNTVAPEVACQQNAGRAMTEEQAMRWKKISKRLKTCSDAPSVQPFSSSMGPEELMTTPPQLLQHELKKEVSTSFYVAPSTISEYEKEFMDLSKRARSSERLQQELGMEVRADVVAHESASRQNFVSTITEGRPLPWNKLSKRLITCINAPFLHRRTPREISLLGSEEPDTMQQVLAKEDGASSYIPLLTPSGYESDPLHYKDRATPPELLQHKLTKENSASSYVLTLPLYKYDKDLGDNIERAIPNQISQPQLTTEDSASSCVPLSGNAVLESDILDHYEGGALQQLLQHKLTKEDSASSNVMPSPFTKYEKELVDHNERVTALLISQTELADEYSASSYILRSPLAEHGDELVDHSKRATPQLISQHELSKKDSASSHGLPSTSSEHKKELSDLGERETPAVLPQQELGMEDVVGFQLAAEQNSVSAVTEEKALRWKKISKHLMSCKNAPFLHLSSPQQVSLAASSEELNTAPPQLLQHEFGQEGSAISYVLPSPHAESEKEPVDHNERTTPPQMSQHELATEDGASFHMPVSIIGGYQSNPLDQSEHATDPHLCENESLKEDSTSSDHDKELMIQSERATPDNLSKQFETEVGGDIVYPESTFQQHRVPDITVGRAMPWRKISNLITCKNAPFLHLRTPDQLSSSLSSEDLKTSSPQILQHELATEVGANSYVLSSPSAYHEKEFVDHSEEATPAELSEQEFEMEVGDVVAAESVSRQNDGSTITEGQALRWKKISKQLITCKNAPFLHLRASDRYSFSLGSEELNTTSPQILQHELAEEDGASSYRPPSSIAEQEEELVDQEERATPPQLLQRELTKDNSGSFYVLKSPIASSEIELLDQSERITPPALPHQEFEMEVGGDAVFPEWASQRNSGSATTEGRALRWKKISKRRTTCKSAPFLHLSGSHQFRLSVGAGEITTTRPQIMRHDLSKQDKASCCLPMSTMAAYRRGSLDHNEQAISSQILQHRLFKEENAGFCVMASPLANYEEGVVGHMERDAPPQISEHEFARSDPLDHKERSTPPQLPQHAFAEDDSSRSYVLPSPIPDHEKELVDETERGTPPAQSHQGLEMEVGGDAVLPESASHHNSGSAITEESALRWRKISNRLTTCKNALFLHPKTAQKLSLSRSSEGLNSTPPQSQHDLGKYDVATSHVQLSAIAGYDREPRDHRDMGTPPHLLQRQLSKEDSGRSSVSRATFAGYRSGSLDHNDMGEPPHLSQHHLPKDDSESSRVLSSPIAGYDGELVDHSERATPAELPQQELEMEVGGGVVSAESSSPQACVPATTEGRELRWKKISKRLITCKNAPFVHLRSPQKCSLSLCTEEMNTASQQARSTDRGITLLSYRSASQSSLNPQIEAVPTPVAVEKSLTTGYQAGPSKDSKEDMDDEEPSEDCTRCPTGRDSTCSCSAAPSSLSQRFKDTTLSESYEGVTRHDSTSSYLFAERISPSHRAKDGSDGADTLQDTGGATTCQVSICSCSTFSTAPSLPLQLDEEKADVLHPVGESGGYSEPVDKMGRNLEQPMVQHLLHESARGGDPTLCAGGASPPQEMTSANYQQRFTPADKFEGRANDGGSFHHRKESASVADSTHSCPVIQRNVSVKEMKEEPSDDHTPFPSNTLSYCAQQHFPMGQPGIPSSDVGLSQYAGRQVTQQDKKSAFGLQQGILTKDSEQEVDRQLHRHFPSISRSDSTPSIFAKQVIRSQQLQVETGLVDPFLDSDGHITLESGMSSHSSPQSVPTEEFKKEFGVMDIAVPTEESSSHLSNKLSFSTNESASTQEGSMKLESTDSLAFTDMISMRQGLSPIYSATDSGALEESKDKDESFDPSVTLDESTSPQIIEPSSLTEQSVFKPKLRENVESDVREFGPRTNKSDIAPPSATTGTPRTVFSEDTVAPEPLQYMVHVPTTLECVASSSKPNVALRKFPEKSDSVRKGLITSEPIEDVKCSRESVEGDESTFRGKLPSLLAERSLSLQQMDSSKGIALPKVPSYLDSNFAKKPAAKSAVRGVGRETPIRILRGRSVAEKSDSSNLLASCSSSQAQDKSASGKEVYVCPLAVPPGTITADCNKKYVYTRYPVRTYSLPSKMKCLQKEKNLIVFYEVSKMKKKTAGSSMLRTNTQDFTQCVSKPTEKDSCFLPSVSRVPPPSPSNETPNSAPVPADERKSQTTSAPVTKCPTANDLPSPSAPRWPDLSLMGGRGVRFKSSEKDKSFESPMCPRRTQPSRPERAPFDDKLDGRLARRARKAESSYGPDVTPLTLKPQMPRVSGAGQFRQRVKGMLGQSQLWLAPDTLKRESKTNQSDAVRKHRGPSRCHCLEIGRQCTCNLTRHLHVRSLRQSQQNTGPCVTSNVKGSERVVSCCKVSPVEEGAHRAKGSLPCADAFLLKKNAVLSTSKETSTDVCDFPSKSCSPTKLVKEPQFRRRADQYRHSGHRYEVSVAARPVETMPSLSQESPSDGSDPRDSMTRSFLDRGGMSEQLPSEITLPAVDVLPTISHHRVGSRPEDSISLRSAEREGPALSVLRESAPASSLGRTKVGSMVRSTRATFPEGDEAEISCFLPHISARGMGLSRSKRPEEVTPLQK